MEIKRITVKGFKNVKNVSLDLHSLLCFVSVNNYGKSNLLKAIDFAFDFISNSEKNRVRMMHYSSGIPFNINMDSDNFIFQIEGVFGNNNDSWFKYGFEFIWHKDDRTGDKIVDEWLDIKESCSNHFKKIFNRKKCEYKKDINAKYKNTINIKSSQLYIDFLPLIDDISYLELIEYIKGIKYNYCSLIDANPSFEPMPFQFLTGDDVIPYNDRDIPRALYHISESDPAKFKVFKSAIMRLFPDFETISFSKHDIEGMMTKKVLVSVGEDEETETDAPPTKIKDQIYQIFIKSKYLNQPMSMETMSAGTKRIFWILLNVLISDDLNVQLLGLEELETSIHPSLLRKLLEEINMLSHNTFILISSHSTNILQYLKPEQIYIGIPNRYGYADFAKIKESKYNKLNTIARNLGMSYGEYIFNYISQYDEDMEDVVAKYFERVENE